MNTADWLNSSTHQLKTANIATARLDCLVLLEDMLNKDKAWLLSHPEYELQGSILEKLNTKIVQRAQHVPLAYIRGKAEFYGREFIVNEHTLVPRPESEAIIDLLKRVRNIEADTGVWQVERRGRVPLKKKYAFERAEPESSLVKTDQGYEVVWNKPTREPVLQSPATIQGNGLLYHDDETIVIDVGTGSGALAITAKLEFPEITIVATDIDENCLKTARTNAERLNAEVTFLQGNLIDSLHQDEILSIDTDTPLYILLCNLPYVPEDFQINTAATHEPKHAIFGGHDGLDLYRELFQQITANTWKPDYLLTESLPSQHDELTRIAQVAGYKLLKTNDFVQLFEMDPER